MVLFATLFWIVGSRYSCELRGFTPFIWKSIFDFSMRSSAVPKINSILRKTKTNSYFLPTTNVREREESLFAAIERMTILATIVCGSTIQTVRSRHLSTNFIFAFVECRYCDRIYSAIVCLVADFASFSTFRIQLFIWLISEQRAAADNPFSRHLFLSRVFSHSRCRFIHIVRAEKSQQLQRVVRWQCHWDLILE